MSDGLCRVQRMLLRARYITKFSTDKDCTLCCNNTHTADEPTPSLTSLPQQLFPRSEKGVSSEHDRRPGTTLSEEELRGVHRMPRRVEPRPSSREGGGANRQNTVLSAVTVGTLIETQPSQTEGIGNQRVDKNSVSRSNAPNKPSAVAAIQQERETRQNEQTE